MIGIKDVETEDTELSKFSEIQEWFRKRRAKVAIKEKASNAYRWCGEHKELVIAGITVGIPATVDIIKVISKRSNVNSERQLKENYVYDRKAGHYWEVKKKPSASDWIKIEELRARHPELSLGIILRDLKMLK